MDLVELVEGGKDIEVNDENKKIYVDLWYHFIYLVLRLFVKKKWLDLLDI